MKRFVAIALALVMTLCVIPVTASAEVSYDAPLATSVTVGDVLLTENTILIQGENEAISLNDLSEDFDIIDGSYVCFVSGMLIISNYNYHGSGHSYALDDESSGAPALISANGSIIVLLNGANSFTAAETDTVGLIANGFIDISGDGIISFTNVYIGIMAFSYTDIDADYIQQSGVVNINACEEGIGIAAASIGTGNASVNINAGVVEVISSDAATATAGLFAMGTDASVNINGGDIAIRNVSGGIGVMGTENGEVNITYGKIEIYTNTNECIAAISGDNLGDINISGGSVTCSSYNDEGAAFAGNVNLSQTVEFAYGSETSVSAEIRERDYVILGGVYLFDGDYLANGATETSKTKPANGGYAYYTASNNKLLLDNFEYTGDGAEYVYGRGEEYQSYYNAVLISYKELSISTVGESTLTAVSAETEGIVVYGDLIMTQESGTATLNINACYGIQTLSFGENNSALIFNSGIYNINSETVGIMISNEGYSNGNFVVKSNDVTLNINAGDVGISLYSTSAISAIVYGGKINVTANYCAMDIMSEMYASLEIEGGDVKLTVSDYGTALSVVETETYNEGKISVFGGSLEIKIPEYNADYATLISGYLFMDITEGIGIIDGSLESTYVKIGEGGFVGGYELGDVNMDGVVDTYDYMIVKRIYFGTISVTDEQLILADINMDGAVDTYDYMLVKRIYFGTYSV